MSIVVDASVLVAALVDTGAEGNWAIGLLAQGSLHAPELARAEVANVLRRLEQAKRITAFEASAAFEDFMRLALDLHAFDPFAIRIWELRHAMTGYDAWYVALAEALNLPLATLDRRLARTRGADCKFVLPVA